MLKALLHKQMLEVRRMYFFNKRKGTMVTGKSGSAGLTVLFVFIYLTMAGTFFALSFLIGGPLLKNGLVWIFFMIMSILAFLAGIIGSVLSTSSALFRAKDNEFLLAMPIPPMKILLARMVSVYIMGLVYESMILLPAILFYFIKGHPSLLSVIFCILGFFILGFLILSFSCFFGWLIALIAGKLKNKTVLTVIISVLVILIFLYFRIRANYLFRELAEHAQEIGEAVQGWGYPIYSLGLGMSGNAVGFLVFTAITAVFFFLTCLIMSKSFLKIVSAKDEASAAAFSEEQIHTRNVGAALRKKEMKRFTSSPAYMVNTGFGLLILVVGAILLLIKSADIRTMVHSALTQIPFLSDSSLAVAGAFAVCVIASMCDIAAPSISLEGQNIWLLQTLPVEPYQIFRAKLFVHVVVVEIPALICGGVLWIVLRPGVIAGLCMLLCIAAFVLFTAAAMLALDLKRPMLDWTSEVQPIKQSLNILFCWLGGSLLSIVLAGLYLFAGRLVGAEIYLLLCTALFVLFTVLLHRWLRGKGSLLFAAL